MLADGSCCEQKRSAIYVMKKRNMGIISDNLISAQVKFKYTHKSTDIFKWADKIVCLLLLHPYNQCFD